MTLKYIHRIDTMDGVIEYESGTPQPPHKTPEEIEEAQNQIQNQNQDNDNNDTDISEVEETEENWFN